MLFRSSWEIFTNVRRELAKAVSRGNAYGAVNSVALLSSTPLSADVEKNYLSAKDVERAARGSSLGSMMGNTGLAFYYPTDELVPIINFTAQGSAFGSTSASNLAKVKKEKTETIDVSVARQSSMGSALGAIFEPTVLFGLRPDQRYQDPQIGRAHV